jgi:hypothetical protein
MWVFGGEPNNINSGVGFAQVSTALPNHINWRNTKEMFYKTKVCLLLLSSSSSSSSLVTGFLSSLVLLLLSQW